MRRGGDERLSAKSATGVSRCALLGRRRHALREADRRRGASRERRRLPILDDCSLWPTHFLNLPGSLPASVGLALSQACLYASQSDEFVSARASSSDSASAVLPPGVAAGRGIVASDSAYGVAIEWRQTSWRQIIADSYDAPSNKSERVSCVDRAPFRRRRPLRRPGRMPPPFER